MYLLTVSHSLNESFRVADTAIDQNVCESLKNLKSINIIENSSRLNIEETNVNILLSIKIIDKENHKIKYILKKIEKQIEEGLSFLINKKPGSIQIMVVNND